jgi:hypothetical protein
MSQVVQLSRLIHFVLWYLFVLQSTKILSLVHNIMKLFVKMHVLLAWNQLFMSEDTLQAILSVQFLDVKQKFYREVALLRPQAL